MRNAPLASRPSSRRRAWTLAALAALPLGCATSGAGTASDEGESHDQIARRELADVATFRTGGHVEAAVAGLDRLLKQLATWGGLESLSPATRATFDTELESSRAFVSGIGAKDAADGRPLAAEGELARLAPLLAHAELAAARTAAETRTRDAGQRVCVRVQSAASADTPHLGLLVSRYCAHFGVTVEAPPIVDGATSFELTGEVAGTVKAAGEHIRARVADWLRSSAWYEREGRGAARGTVNGKVDASLGRRTVTLHAPYRDRIVTETGSTEKSATLPETLRAWADPNSATSVTEIDRDYAYDAEETRGHYDLGVKVTLALGSTPVTFTLQRAENLRGYEHDASFAPAGVAPRHDPVPAPAQWLDGQLERMSTKVVALLNRKFVSTYCAPSTVTLEEASHCVASGQRAPAAVAVVARTFGEDADQLLAVLRPPPPPTAARPGGAPPPKAKARAEDDDNTIIN
jgi:hypothetical protein